MIASFSQCVEIETDRGVITVSAGHLFVQRHAKVARHWQRADQLQPGDQILYMGDPWDEDRSWEAGWLAGFYDGEGSLSGHDADDDRRSGYLLEVAQKEGPELDLCRRILDAKGYDYGLKIKSDAGRKEHHSPIWQIYLRGENAKCRFLGEIRPRRLLAKSHRAWEGMSVMRNNGCYVTVQRVRSVGKQEVLAVATSQKTLITNGYLSHNSMFHPDQETGTVMVGQLNDYTIVGGHEYLIQGIDYQREVIVCLNSWGTGWGGGNGLTPGQFRITFKDLENLLAAEGDIIVPHGRGLSS